MSAITTHVLDTSCGRPAAGVNIVLEIETGAGWRVLGQGATDMDGRARSLLPDEFTLAVGVYRLTFRVADYFAAQGVESFYAEVAISFRVGDAAEHYHVPLLLNPYGYSTYRGS